MNSFLFPQVPEVGHPFKVMTVLSPDESSKGPGTTLPFHRGCREGQIRTEEGCAVRRRGRVEVPGRSTEGSGGRFDDGNGRRTDDSDEVPRDSNSDLRLDRLLTGEQTNIENLPGVTSQSRGT